MNEIEAEVSGQVIEILVQNGEPVEFGQPLLRVNLLMITYCYQRFNCRILGSVMVILMKSAKPVPPEVVQQVAEYFSLLSEPMRLRLLNLLRDGEKCVQELVEATQTSQANVSKHLKIMWQVLRRRSEGTSAYYSVEDDMIFELCNLVCDRLAMRIEQQARQFRVLNGKQ